MPLGILIFCMTFLFCLLSPDTAFAWGPGAHLVTGNWLLQNLSALPAQIAAVLMLSPGQFLHGLLGADIFIGKGCKAKIGHSHNWESGFNLLESARSDQQQAYAYGYLCHLAADTVAHNVFVPGLIHTAPGKGKTAHVYLEAQADSLLDWNSGEALTLFTQPESPAALTMLRHSMNKGLLPFWLSTRMYQSSIMIGGSKIWRGSIGAVDKLFTERERKEQLSYLLNLSTKAMFNVLQRGPDSQVLLVDPIGADSLSLAEKRAGNGRALFTRGLRRTISRKLEGFQLPGHSGLIPLPSQNSNMVGCPLPDSFGVDVPSVLLSLPAVCGRNKE